MINWIKNSFVIDSLINLYIRLYISIFKINGNLKLKYQYKRRTYMLQYLNRKNHINGKIDRNHKEKIKNFLITNFNGYRDISWSLCYIRINGIFDHRYIPDDIYYDFIEKKLNNFTLVYSYNDKNMYKRLFADAMTPKTLFRIMNGKLYDENYQPLGIGEIKSRAMQLDWVVFKPSIDSGGGKNVMIDSPNVIMEYVETLLRTSKNRVELNYIGQHCLIQHERLAFFHPESVNTMRIMTLRIGHEIVHLSSVLRMGRGNSKIDNQMGGGISCGIDGEGKLKKHAYDKVFKSFEKHPNTGISFEGQEIPMYSEAVSLAKKLHDETFYFDIISWDITVGNDNNVYLIELNLCWQGLNLHQISNGPLFGDYTEKVLSGLGRS